MAATSQRSRMRESLIGYWRGARPPQRFAYLVGGALVVVGLAHLVAWLVVGGAWEGPVSFRKPATFGISFGLTAITLAWVAGYLRISERTGWLLLGPLAVANSAEVAWVSVQRWRGVPAHFAQGTPDAELFQLMGVVVVVIAAVILVVTALAFTAMSAASSMALAIRAGLGILLVAQAVGGWMIQHGMGLVEEGATDGLTTFGAAGVMKVPHAVGIHGIQVLPALAWLLSFAALTEQRRLALVRVAVGGYLALVVVSVLQAAGGLAPFDVGVLAATLYLLGIVLLGMALVTTLLALRTPARA
jgi:hypothetical protein